MVAFWASGPTRHPHFPANCERRSRAQSERNQEQLDILRGCGLDKRGCDFQWPIVFAILGEHKAISPPSRPCRSNKTYHQLFLACLHCVSCFRFFFFFFPFFSSSSSHFAVMRYTLGNIDAAAEGEIPSESKCILAYQFSGKWVRVARSYGEMQDAGPS